MTQKDGGPAFPTETRNLGGGGMQGGYFALGSDGMSLRDFFAAKAGDPPEEVVRAFKEAIPMERTKYRYGDPDISRVARVNDMKDIAKYHAKMRAAWADAFADAMMEARNVR